MLACQPAFIRVGSTDHEEERKVVQGLEQAFVSGHRTLLYPRQYVATLEVEGASTEEESDEDEDDSNYRRNERGRSLASPQYHDLMGSFQAGVCVHLYIYISAMQPPDRGLAFCKGIISQSAYSGHTGISPGSREQGGKGQ